ncbi:MAG: ATP-binding protein [Bryobacterales bacterium]|nr:ATP-binding protein [Bryobacterales bacterium]
MIVVFSGPPCSGKSHLGELLAAARDFAHLEMDAVRLRILPDAAHTREDRSIAYRAMHYAAELLAAQDRPVIVNAGYSHAEDRREIEQVAFRVRTPLHLVEFAVSPETAVERSRLRRIEHAGLDLTDARVAELVRGFPYFRGGLVIDSECPAESSLRRILDHLARGKPLSPGAWPAAGR